MSLGRMYKPNTHTLMPTKKNRVASKLRKGAKKVVKKVAKKVLKKKR